MFGVAYCWHKARIIIMIFVNYTLELLTSLSLSLINCWNFLSLFTSSTFKNYLKNLSTLDEVLALIKGLQTCSAQ